MMAGRRRLLLGRLPLPLPPLLLLLLLLGFRTTEARGRPAHRAAGGGGGALNLFTFANTALAGSPTLHEVASLESVALTPPAGGPASFELSGSLLLSAAGNYAFSCQLDPALDMVFVWMGDHMVRAL